MEIIIAILAGMILYALFGRYIIIIITYIFMAISIAFAYRVLETLDRSLVPTGFPLGALTGGIVGFIVVGIVCVDRIRHILIHFYLRRAIQRDKDAAQAGRLW